MTKTNIFKKTVVAIVLSSFAAASAFAQPSPHVSIDIAGLLGDYIISTDDILTLIAEGVSDATFALQEDVQPSLWSQVNHKSVFRDILSRALPTIGIIEVLAHEKTNSAPALATKWIVTAGNAVFATYVQEYMQLYITRHTNLSPDNAKLVALLLMHVELGAWQGYFLPAITSKIDSAYKGNDKTELRRLQASLSSQGREQLNEINASLKALHIYATSEGISINGQSKSLYGTKSTFSINAKKTHDIRDIYRYKYNQCVHYANMPPQGEDCFYGVIY